MTLPICPVLPVKWGSKKKPVWDTVVKKSGSGKRRTMTNQSYPLWEIEVDLVGLDEDQRKEITAFLYSVKGRLEPFLWWDYEDHQEIKVSLGIGQGSVTDWQLVRRYKTVYTEPVTDLVANTLTVYINDVKVTNYSLLSNGIIRFTTPPTGDITASFQYYWRVALDDDDIGWEHAFNNISHVKNFKMVSVR